MNLVKSVLSKKYFHNVSYSYWNDRTIEKSKSYNVLDYGLDKLKSSKKILKQIEIVKYYLNLFIFDFKKKNIFSLASGVCYLEAALLERKDFYILFLLGSSDKPNHQQDI